MNVWWSLEEALAHRAPSVVTIGNFDGVHRGHHMVIDAVIAEARRRQACAVAMTFDPHPAHVHRPEQAAPLLTGLTDRLELLAQLGLDAVCVVEYSLEFAQQSPRDFVKTWIVDALAATAVVIGRDVRFGRDNSGDLSTLRDLGQEFGFDVVVVDDHGSPGGGERWSSSIVRQLVRGGEMGAVTQLLGRPHRMRGVVVHGDARGRELGFPTANMSPDSDGMVPADGVYAGYVSVVGEQRALQGLPAAISVGTNPTFDGQERRVEAYVIGHNNLDLYDKNIMVEFVERLRPTVTFSSLDALIDQMHDDVTRAKLLLR